MNKARTVSAYRQDGTCFVEGSLTTSLQKHWEQTDTNTHLFPSFHLSNLLSKATDQVYQRKTGQHRHRNTAFCVFVRAPHSTCLWGLHMQLLAQRWAAQIPFQPSACQSFSTCPPSTEDPHTTQYSQPNAFAEPPGAAPHTHTHTYLHWCSPGNPRTACWQWVHRGLNLCLITESLCMFLSLHFLVVLYAVTYTSGRTPAHWLFHTDTPGGWVSFPNSFILLPVSQGLPAAASSSASDLILQPVSHLYLPLTANRQV